MPQSAVSTLLPPSAQPDVQLRPQNLHPSLAKKIQRCTVFACTGVDKLSTKWKKQRRLLVATASLLLICKQDGDVRRVIDFADIEELALQQEGPDTMMLVKLGVTLKNEPDLLCVAHVDKRATHPPSTFLAVVAAMVKQRKAFSGVQYLPGGGFIRGMARLGHNPISAKLKLKQIAAKPHPPCPPAVCAQPSFPQPPAGAGAPTAQPRRDSPERFTSNSDEREGHSQLSDKHTRLTDPLPSPPASRGGLPDLPSPIRRPSMPEREYIVTDSKPPSEASGRTPHTYPSVVSHSHHDAPLSPLESFQSAGKVPGPLDQASQLQEFKSDSEVIAPSRLRTAQPDVSRFMPKFDEVHAPPSGVGDMTDGSRRKPRSVSFTTPTTSTEAKSIVEQNQDVPVIRSSAASMPPIKSLPEDDEGGCGWTEHKDPASGLTYYHNSQLGKSTWHEPDELKQWKAKQDAHVSHSAAQSTSALSVGKTPGSLRKPEALLHQQMRAPPAEQHDDSDDSSSYSDDDVLGPAPRVSTGPSIQGMKRMLDAPPVRVSVAPRIPRTHVQPVFAETPIDATPGPLSKMPSIGGMMA